MDAESEAVILLHGLGRSPRSMIALQWKLRGAGYRVHNLSYPSRRHTLEALARDWLSPAIDELIGQGAARIHVVTHSMGGILLRTYLRDTRPSQLGHVVMLAPPNGGSEIIDRLGRYPWFAATMGPAALQLDTSADRGPQRLGAADFKLGIIAGSVSPNPLARLFFDSINDGKVALTRTRLEGMSDFLVVPYGHTFIMQRRVVTNAVLHFLRHGRFPAAPHA